MQKLSIIALLVVNIVLSFIILGQQDDNTPVEYPPIFTNCDQVVSEYLDQAKEGREVITIKENDGFCMIQAREDYIRQEDGTRSLVVEGIEFKIDHYLFEVVTQ